MPQTPENQHGHRSYLSFPSCAGGGLRRWLNPEVDPKNAKMTKTQIAEEPGTGGTNAPGNPEMRAYPRSVPSFGACGTDLTDFHKSGPLLCHNIDRVPDRFQGWLGTWRCCMWCDVTSRSNITSRLGCLLVLYSKNPCGVVEAGCGRREWAAEAWELDVAVRGVSCDFLGSAPTRGNSNGGDRRTLENFPTPCPQGKKVR